MFEFFRKHMRLFQIILAVLIIPSFAFLGLQGYNGMNEGANKVLALEIDRHPDPLG